MAQIESGGGNGKGKSHQKKMTIRVDFTPMVDMNMLLITFFMLCTTMIKTQTLNIALPSNKENLSTEQMNQASASDAVTIIVDAKRLPNGQPDTVGGIKPEIYYYEGKPAEIPTPTGGIKIVDESDPAHIVVNMPAGQEKLMKATFNMEDKDGIRSFIMNRNKDVLAAITPLREKFKAGQISQAQFDSLARVERNKEQYGKLTIIIKATDYASYGSLVSLLDEMQINQIARYQIDNLTPVDKALLDDFIRRHK
ncbi:MAG: biopolymer transporter ExbD [Clostridium sp.]|nr:biopolymer transporter ExbD [Clostridium sp.]